LILLRWPTAALGPCHHDEYDIKQTGFNGERLIGCDFEKIPEWMSVLIE
jgi:hypothetical protein